MKVQKLGYKPILGAILAAVLIMSMLLSVALPSGAIASPASNAITPMLTAGNVPSTADANSGEKLLQFTSSGHVLGFSPDGVMIASGGHMLKAEFIGSNAVAPQADTAAPAENSASMASPLSRVTYHDAWDDITVVYEANPGSIVKSTYYINATDKGIPVERIRLGYNRPLTIDDQGNLVIAYESGNMVESAPVAWQEIDGQRTPVTVAYALYGQQEVGFSLGGFKPGIPVVIDPALAWNTFLGGEGDDDGDAIVVDGSGNVYVSGCSNATWGSPVQTYTADYDAFAAKIDSSGNLVWNTFLGGTYADEARAIAVDGSGNVYLGGYSYKTWGSPVRAFQAGSDAWAARLSDNGSLTWHTFLGGTGEEWGNAIAVDGSGNVYLAGNSRRTWGSPVQPYIAGHDGYAVKLSDNGSLTWHTFLGGNGDDVVQSIAVDNITGNVYLAGYSSDTWGGSPVSGFAGGFHDGFAAKLNSSGGLIWNTFLGGANDDYSTAIAMDGSGNIYVAGKSNSSWGSPVRDYTSSNYDAFAARLDNNGGLTWNTFLGNDGNDRGYAIEVDSGGNVYVGGTSSATWGSPWRAYTGGDDAFAAKLVSENGSLTWNSFLGDNNTDSGKAIAVDGNGNVWVAGFSNTTWGFPVQSHSINADAFAAKITQTANTAKAITAFNFNGLSPAVIGVITEAKHTIAVTVPYGTSVTALVPTITHTGASIDPASGAANNFTTPQTYTVTAANASIQAYTVTVTVAAAPSIATYLNGIWYLDYNGNGIWNGTGGGDKQYSFGNSSMTPVSGNWNGTGGTEIGAFLNGTWYLDYNGNGVWNGTGGGDRQYTFGNASMKPVSGDWNSDNKTEIGAFLNGTWYIDYNGNGVWNGTGGGDRLYTFGNSSMKPVTGNWNGDGKTEIGAFYNGTWYLDYNGNGVWNGTGGGDRQYTFGNASMIPVSGNWNGTGGTEIGAFYNGTWYLDYNGNGVWNGVAGGDKQYTFGNGTMKPVSGAW